MPGRTSHQLNQKLLGRDLDISISKSPQITEMCSLVCEPLLLMIQVEQLILQGKKKVPWAFKNFVQSHTAD